MYLFISHSSKNAETAKRICEFLEEKGKKCFLAPRDIRAGREYAEEIINGIDQADLMILIMSEAANQSPHVLREVERAVSKSVPILVYKLEDVQLSKSMEYFLMTHQWFDAKPQEDFSGLWKYVCGYEKEATEKSSPEKRKSRKLYWIAAAILFALILVGAGVGLIRYTNSRPEAFVCPYELGDTVTFGNYNGAPIEWRVLRISEDGTQAVLVAKQILTMKAFDAPESGRYNWDGEEDYWMEEELVAADPELQVRVRGNSDWSTSNIRTWLNSEAEIVNYEDQPPMATAMAEKKNGYQNEPGFLYAFTAEERNAILETENITNGNALSSDTVTTQDRVYLLSLEELTWFDEAGISKLAVPTEEAVEQDTSNWYLIDVTEYDIDEYSWWLREPVEDSAGACYLVGNGYTADNIRQASVGLEGFGIRPAITVNLRSDCFRTEQ